jgi:hypothetical protein
MRDEETPTSTSKNSALIVVDERAVFTNRVLDGSSCACNARQIANAFSFAHRGVIKQKVGSEWGLN